MSNDFSPEFNGIFKNVPYNKGVLVEFFKDKKKALKRTGIKDD
jgi:hypothetical protein